MKMLMWVLVIVALAVGLFIGYYYEKSKMASQLMMVESSAQKQVSDLKMKNDELMKAQSMENAKMTPQPSGAMMHGNISPTGVMQK